MLTALVLGVFFLMLLAPCLSAVFGTRAPRETDDEVDAQEQAAPTAPAAMAVPEPAVVSTVASAQLPAVEATSPLLIAESVPVPALTPGLAGQASLADSTALPEIASVEIARVQALRSLLEAAEVARARADAAKMETLVRSLDLSDLRRMVAVAESEAIAAQVVAAETKSRNEKLAAAQARAAELAVASKLAGERAALATQAAEVTRLAAEEATRAAQAARDAYARRQQEGGELAGATDPAGKLPDGPSMHYPRARSIHRAA